MTFEENGIVTTSYRCTQSDEEIALLASERTGMQYVRRGSMSYENLMKEYDVDVILVAKKQQLIYRNDQIALVCVKAEHTCPDTPSGNQLRMQQQPGGIEKKEKKC